MASSFPSIQSFYRREVSGMSGATYKHTRGMSDGFTGQEISAALHPLSQPWKPSREYHRCPISLLQGGPHNYEITGRVANFSTPTGRNHVQSSTEGQYLIVLNDNSGAIAVRLFYTKPRDFNLILGQRVTIFTTYMRDSAKAETGYTPYVTYCTTIFPGRNGATHIIFHIDVPSSEDGRLCRIPPGVETEHEDGRPGLMSLKSFLASGFDMEEGKILVCVRSVGLCKTIYPRKRKEAVDLVEVGIFDDTATSVLKLWGDHVVSARTFVPNQTILLICHPTCKAIGRHNEKFEAVTEVGIGYNSTVYLDPAFAEAIWLAKKIGDLTKKETVLTQFPAGIWDAEAAMNGSAREVFTIAEVDKSVRQGLERNFTGKLNVMILEVNLTNIWRKRMLCCNECCGAPLYANRLVGTCKNCGLQRELSLNPRVLGVVVDESGTLTAVELCWKDTAWTQLFFGDLKKTRDADADEIMDLIEQSWEDLTALDILTLKDIEEQMQYSRVTLIFGWCSKLGRLCVLGVEW